MKQGLLHQTFKVGWTVKIVDDEKYGGSYGTVTKITKAGGTDCVYVQCADGKEVRFSRLAIRPCRTAWYLVEDGASSYVTDEMPPSYHNYQGFKTEKAARLALRAFLDSQIDGLLATVGYYQENERDNERQLKKMYKSTGAYMDDMGFVALPVLLGLLAFLLVLTACGGSKGTSPPSSPSLVAPVVSSPVVTASVFDGRQYQNTNRACVMNPVGTAPAWNCYGQTMSAYCHSLTVPTMLKIHTGEADAWGSGFEAVTYDGAGNFVLTSSGYAWQMVWAWSNNVTDPWSPSIASGGVVVRVESCAIYFVDYGSI